MAFQDMMALADGVEQAYHVPNLRLNCYMARTNVPPRTNMRAPGFFQVGEQIVAFFLHHRLSRP